MEDYNEHSSEFETGEDNKTPYQPRSYKNTKGAGKKKSVTRLLALLLIALLGIGIFWYFSDSRGLGLPVWLSESFAPEEEAVQIELPEALFAGKDVEEFTAWAVEEQGVGEITRSDEGSLIITMTAEVRGSLLEEAENNLENIITALNDEEQHPHIVDISYDGAYNNFYLVVNLEQTQSNRVLFAASELFMQAVYYQYIAAAADPVREVSISIEDIDTGSVTEQLAYPGDLNRVAAILEDPEALIEVPTTPQPGDKVIVRTGPDNLNLRDGPEITYLIIDILSSGTVLEVTGTEGVWLKVITPEGLEGWVHGDFVEIYPGDDE